MANSKPIETRGRKANARGRILSNGLFESQQEQLLESAEKHNRDSAAVILREIVDMVYDERIVEYAHSLGDSEVKVLSQIVGWFFDGKEAMQGISIEEFEKLSNKSNHKQTQGV